MSKRESDPEHIEVLDPTWNEDRVEVRMPARSGLLISERMLGRLAWFSVIATMTTVLVAFSVVVVAVAVLLNEPEPVVFDRAPLPRVRSVPVRTAQRALPEAAVDEGAEPDADALLAPVVVAVPSEALPPAPAPELPVDLPTQELVPGQLPGGVAAAGGPTQDTADEAAEALQSDRLTIRLLSEPPGADVRVDGRFRGRTPVKLTVNPGRYEIVMKLQSAKTRWTLDATGDERRCFAADGRALVDVGCD